MNSNKMKKIATWIVVPLMASVFILDIITVALCNHYCKQYPITKETFDGAAGDDRIHFLNTANSDAILLESNGHFALIDSGEGNSNPRRKTAYRGFEEEVVAYLLKVAGKNGKAHLDFVLATHCHYDHIGSFHAILTNKNITVDTAYFKGIDTRFFKSYEKRWGMTDTLLQIQQDAAKQGIPVELPPEQMVFGDFALTFYNVENDPDLFGKGENSESIGIKVQKGDKSAFLAADITAPSGLEDKLMNQIGDIDLLKIGHHGYFGSSSMRFLRAVKPELAVVTNQLGKVYPNVKWNLTMTARCPFYATYDNHGLIVTFADKGDLLLTNEIM